MKSNVYAVFDTKSGAFASPFVMPTHAMAIRGFADHCKDPNSMAGKHPLDFALFHIGEYEDSNGVLAPQVPPVSLGLASEFLTQG